MNRSHAKSVVLDMAFRDMALYDRFSRDVSKKSTVTQNILRGRVTPEGAWMRLELRGASRRVNDLIGRWGECIVTTAGGPEVAA